MIASLAPISFHLSLFWIPTLATIAVIIWLLVEIFTSKDVGVTGFLVFVGFVLVLAIWLVSFAVLYFLMQSQSKFINSTP